MAAGKLRSFIVFCGENFGPLIVFYLTEHWLGLRAAVATSIVFTVGVIIAKYFRGRRVTRFFLFSAGVTVLFGVLDLTLATPVFVKYEAVLTNIITGLYFGATLFAERPLIQEFAERDGPVRGATPREDIIFYFRFITFVWTGYFFLKAAIYSLLASRYSLDEAMALRSVIGGISFYALLGASMFLARPIILALRAMRVLPSVRRRAG